MTLSHFDMSEETNYTWTQRELWLMYRAYMAPQNPRGRDIETFNEWRKGNWEWLERHVPEGNNDK